MRSFNFIEMAIASAFILVASLSWIAFAGVKIAEKFPGDIRTVWYLVSLSSVCTGIAALWARSIGALDSHGVFQGPWGSYFNSSLKFVIDLESDINFFGAVLIIIVLPQLATYLLSGLFGCASAPIFVSKAVSFFVWGVVKSFSVSSGVLLSLAIYGLVSGLESWTTKGTLNMGFFSLMLLMLSFLCLYMYREIASSSGEPNERALRVQGHLSRLHCWFTRRSHG